MVKGDNDMPGKTAVWHAMQQATVDQRRGDGGSNSNVDFFWLRRG